MQILIQAEIMNENPNSMTYSRIFKFSLLKIFKEKICIQDFKKCPVCHGFGYDE